MVDYDDIREPEDGQPRNDRTDAAGFYNPRVNAFDHAAVVGSYKPVPRRARRTGGAIPRGAEQAWVYVATDAAGLVKLGMTSNIPQRMKSLKADLRMSLAVTPEAARHIETQAFQAMGHDLAQGEWAGRDAIAAMAALWRAYTDAARALRVEPSLSHDDARKLRIALAQQAGAC